MHLRFFFWSGFAKISKWSRVHLRKHDFNFLRRTGRCRHRRRRRRWAFNKRHYECAFDRIVEDYFCSTTALGCFMLTLAQPYGHPASRAIVGQFEVDHILFSSAVGT